MELAEKRSEIQLCLVFSNEAQSDLTNSAFLKKKLQKNNPLPNATIEIAFISFHRQTPFIASHKAYSSTSFSFYCALLFNIFAKYP